MWLYMMAFMITSVVEQDFFINKACRVDHDLSEETCANLKANETLNTEVQASNYPMDQDKSMIKFILTMRLLMYY